MFGVSDLQGLGAASSVTSNSILLVITLVTLSTNGVKPMELEEFGWIQGPQVMFSSVEERDQRGRKGKGKKKKKKKRKKKHGGGWGWAAPKKCAEYGQRCILDEDCCHGPCNYIGWAYALERVCIHTPPPQFIDGIHYNQKYWKKKAKKKEKDDKKYYKEQTKKLKQRIKEIPQREYYGWVSNGWGWK